MFEKKTANSVSNWPFKRAELRVCIVTSGII